MTADSGKVLELVVFKVNQGVSREQLLDSVGAVSTWISRQPGFLSRELSYDPDGDRWVEVVWWRSLEEAQAASERAMSSQDCAPMFALIDEEATLMLHAELAIPPVHAAGEAAAA